MSYMHDASYLNNIEMMGEKYLKINKYDEIFRLSTSISAHFKERIPLRPHQTKTY